MKYITQVDSTIRKPRIALIVKKCFSGFYLILLVSVICLLVLVAIMLFI